MPFTFEQITGKMLDPDGNVIGIGYSGFGVGVNAPQLQDVPDVGPCPVGLYTIQPPVDTETHGPFVLWLTPDPTNEMYGRSGFGIHGDSIVNASLRMASKGCIILSRDVRQQLWDNADHSLQVVSGLPI